jgi:hypothetical protein
MNYNLTGHDPPIRADFVSSSVSASSYKVRQKKLKSSKVPLMPDRRAKPSHALVI